MSEIRRSERGQAAGNTGELREADKAPDAPTVNELVAQQHGGSSEPAANYTGTVRGTAAAAAASAPVALTRPATDPPKSILAKAVEHQLNTLKPQIADASLQCSLAATSVRASEPEVAKCFDEASDGLTRATDAFTRGGMQQGLDDIDGAFVAATEGMSLAVDADRQELNNAMEAVDEVRNLGDESLRLVRLDLLAKGDVLAELGDGDAVAVELAAGVDLALAKGAIRERLTVSAVTEPDGSIGYRGRLELQLEAAEKGKTKHLDQSIGGAGTVGIAFRADSPEDAATLAAKAAALGSAAGVANVATGDLSALETLGDALTSVSVTAEVGTTVEASTSDGPGPFSKVAGGAKVFQTDTYVLNEEGNVQQVVRERVVEMEAALSRGASLKLGGVEAEASVQAHAAKVSLSMRRTWNMGEDGYGFSDAIKLGAEQMSMGVLSADADDEGVELAVTLGDETSRAALKNHDPGVLEAIGEAIAGEPTGSMLDDVTIEATTTTHRIEKVSLGTKGIGFTAETSVTVIDQESQRSQTTSLREFLAAFTTD